MVEERVGAREACSGRGVMGGCAWLGRSDRVGWATAARFLLHSCCTGAVEVVEWAEICCGPLA